MSERDKLKERVETAVQATMVALIAVGNKTPCSNGDQKVYRPTHITANIDIGDGITLSIEFPVTNTAGVAATPSIGGSVSWDQNGNRVPPKES